MKSFRSKLGKKSEVDEDLNRTALFGSRAKKDTSVSANPYANPITAQDPYTQAKLSVYGREAPPRGPSPTYGGGGPPPRQGLNGDPSGLTYDNDNKLRSEKTAYGEDRYGAQTGYGSERYGSGHVAPPVETASQARFGGYGGLGRTNSFESTTTDANRDALFGGAKERIQQKQAQPPPYGAGSRQDGQSGAYSGEESQGYGAYEDRQLTAEEEEEEDVQATKQQIRFMKQEDVSSTRNALRVAAQAEFDSLTKFSKVYPDLYLNFRETGRNTLARLGAQGERIHNTERNLDLASSHNRTAEEKARELKRLNGSMFAVHVSNPFTKQQRLQAMDEDVIAKNRSERELRDQTRKEGFGTNQRLDRTFRDLQPGDAGYNAKKKEAALAERAKYQFEADSEDDEMEGEIEGNLDLLSAATGRLNGLARATGKEVDEQNRHLERITGKSDYVDDQIALNRARLDRFH